MRMRDRRSMGQLVTSPCVDGHCVDLGGPSRQRYGGWAPFPNCRGAGWRKPSIERWPERPQGVGFS